jgi:hypothetical protein
LLKVEKTSSALHPNEVVVAITTSTGPERIVVHKRALLNNALEIGYPISERDDLYLIELPRETMSGIWRVWVPRTQVQQSQKRSA